MNSSGSRTPYVSRAARTCSTIRSRNVWSPRTGSSDLAFSIPMDVPSPPLSLMIAVRPSASAACSGLTSTALSIGGSVSGSMLSSGMRPVTPSSSWW